MEALFLTRTRYQNGLSCPKMLWFRLNRREAFGETEIPAQAVENSRMLQITAHGLFSEVTVIGHGEYAVMEKETQKALSGMWEKIPTETASVSDALNPVLSHAAFSFQNCHCIVDFLALRPDGSFELYMVKGAAHVSAAVREDLSYQYYVCRMAGLRIKKAAVLYLNRDYVLRGDGSDGRDEEENARCPRPDCEAPDLYDTDSGTAAPAFRGLLFTL